MTATWRLITGDCRDTLRQLEPGSVQTCVTSPPYFGLRDYGHDGQFVTALVEVFREVRRVLRDDGTLWLNLGDSYATSPGNNAYHGKGPNTSTLIDAEYHARRRSASKWQAIPADLKQKDLIGVPWMVAFALRADGWYLRSDIIWNKPNPMPESVTDRPTKSHEYVFLLSKGPRYFYDTDAIREPHVYANDVGRVGLNESGRNKRSVWTVATQPYPGAHFATFPPKLIEPCILAGCPEGGTVLDPFAGAGTTGMVALRKGRSFIGIELSPAYAELARDRIIADSPLLNTHAEQAA